MALVGSISGSVGFGAALRSANAISGTLVVANTSANFPTIPADPTDTVLYAQGSIVASNEIHASGNLRLMNSSGDEGGEIFLNKSVTNTTLNGGVTIDVYQNKLRFFEQGGTARGYYLDITNGGAGVGTNLGASSASPGGSDTYVQFNDGSSFGGDSGFTYNKTTDSITVTGNITGSNALLSGDLAINGGDVTSTSSTFNLLNANVTTINFGGVAQTFNIGASSGLMKIKNPASTVGNDVSLFISGSTGGTGVSGVTVVGGDLVVSGNITANGFRSGSLYTYSKQTTSYNLTVTDSIIGVSGSAASTIRLPAHSTCVSGQYFIIKDEAGNAGTYNITISGSSSPGTDTIDGQLGTLLSNNYGAVTIYRGSDSGKFFIV